MDRAVVTTHSARRWLLPPVLLPTICHLARSHWAVSLHQTNGLVLTSRCPTSCN